MLGRHVPHSGRITQLLGAEIIVRDSHPIIRGRIDVAPHHGLDARLDRSRVITRKLPPPIRRPIVALVRGPNVQDPARSRVGLALAARKRDAGVVPGEVEVHEASGGVGIVLHEGVVGAGSGVGDPAGAVGGGDPAVGSVGTCSSARGRSKPELGVEIAEAEPLD